MNCFKLAQLAPKTAIAAFILAFTVSTHAETASGLPAPISDDFDDGDAAGWTQIDTLGAAGLAEPTLFEFPSGNGFRIDARGTHPFQWARSGAVREDCESQEVVIEVDIVDFETRNHEIGISGRVEGWGLDKNRGYFLFYNPRDEKLKLWRVVADNPGGISVLKTVAIDLGERSAFHLKLRIVGDQLIGAISGVDTPDEPLATIEATDGEIAGGHCGLSVLAPGAGMPAAATFDNFKAYHPDNRPKEESSALSIGTVSKLENQLSIELTGVNESDRLHLLESTNLVQRGGSKW
jgi:hypothetical protein